jgi:hypothetical protein
MSRPGQLYGRLLHSSGWDSYIVSWPELERCSCRAGFVQGIQKLRALAAQKGPVSVLNWAEVAALQLKV